METKRAKVIMLPTEDKTAPILKYKGDCSLQYFPNTYWSNKDLTKQHLYITTDDEIKKGDWVYNTFNDNQPKIQQRKGDWKTCFNQHKIIATTDKSLKCYGCENTMWRDTYQCKCLPQPSQAFIEKYCKVGGIDEVLVEYELKQEGSMAMNLADYTLKVDSHKTITIHPVKDSWTREEVEELCNLYEAIINGDFSVMLQKDMDKRIKEIKQ